MFKLHFLRRILKSRMKPIPEQRAQKLVERLSLAYAFIGWHFVAYLLYRIWKKNIPDGPEKLKKYADIMASGNVTVMTFSGFTKTQEYEISSRTEETPNEKFDQLSPPAIPTVIEQEKNDINYQEWSSSM